MKITGISRKGRTITLKGSFQPGDLKTILEAANAGMLTVPTNPNQLAMVLTSQVEDSDSQEKEAAHERSAPDQ